MNYANRFCGKQYFCAEIRLPRIPYIELHISLVWVCQLEPKCKVDITSFNCIYIVRAPAQNHYQIKSSYWYISIHWSILRNNLLNNNNMSFVFMEISFCSWACLFWNCHELCCTTIASVGNKHCTYIPIILILIFPSTSIPILTSTSA